VREERFTIEVPPEELADLKRRLVATQWPADFDNDNWRFGVEREWLRDSVSWWVEKFDWRRTEAEMNGLDHRKVWIDDLPIHFVHSGIGSG
jgi:hypothetical protein